ncbi:MAG: hypothetical protein M1438_09920 [Deltaproteobacteria bacterium]|nr:hypothetical protein [Deltaproteobacteria bacterium]
MSPFSSGAAGKTAGVARTANRTATNIFAAGICGKLIDIPPINHIFAVSALQKTKACQVDRLHLTGLIILDRLCLAARPDFSWPGLTLSSWDFFLFIPFYKVL